MKINPAELSKINWTNGLAFVVALAAVFGVAIPSELQDTVLKVISLGVPLATVVLRTFFTARTE